MTLITNILIIVVCIAASVVLLRHVGTVLIDLSFPEYELKVESMQKAQSEPATIENYRATDFKKFAEIFKDFSFPKAGYYIQYDADGYNKVHIITENYDSIVLAIWTLPMDRYEYANIQRLNKLREGFIQEMMTAISRRCLQNIDHLQERGPMIMDHAIHSSANKGWEFKSYDGFIPQP